MAAHLSLAYIRFNIDVLRSRSAYDALARGATSACYLRRDRETSFEDPDWTEKVGIDPASVPASASLSSPEWLCSMGSLSPEASREHSRACYILSEVEAAKPAVVVAVRLNGADPASLWIRAEPEGNPLLGPLGPKNLGDEDCLRDEYDEDILLCPLILNTHKIKVTGRTDVTWRWFLALGRAPFSLPWLGAIGERIGRPLVPWKTLGRSHHRIYVVPDTPLAPWVPDMASAFNLWSRALDVACTLADGTSEARSVARRLTRGIHLDLGLLYDTGEDDAVGGEAAYSFHSPISYSSGTYWIMKLMLVAWLDYHEGHPTLPTASPETINCLDSAALLATFARLLGCPLDPVWHSPFGYLKPVRPIGRDLCNNPFHAMPPYSPTPLIPEAEMQAVGSEIHHVRIVGGTAEDRGPIAYFALHAYARMGSEDLTYDATLRGEATDRRGEPFMDLFERFSDLPLSYALPRLLWPIGLLELMDRIRGWLIGISHDEFLGAVRDVVAGATDSLGLIRLAKDSGEVKVYDELQIY